MPTFDATGYNPVPPGLYNGRFMETRAANGQHGPYDRWEFEIDEGEFKGRKVHANVGRKFGPQAKARQWCEQMLGRPIKKGERFDTDVLLGEVYHIMVENSEPDERGTVYDNVVDVHRIRPEAQDTEPPNLPKPNDPEEDFGQIPL